MVNTPSEYAFENKKLAQTLSIAANQLNQAKRRNDENRLEIITAKKELREDTSHNISGLWGADGFEALVELSQQMNPVLDKITEYEEVEKKILQLENLIKSPYFARIDFKFDDEDTFENIYIGRSSLKKDESYDLEVYDWRTPIASVFYRFVLGQVFYDAPSGKITGEVNLKRQYEISNSVLEYFFDADIQIVDEFLRKLLSQNTSSTMKTIVETIQKEQDIVIRDMDNDLMMVQGVAGSGKTSIALHRAAYLMYQGLSDKLSAHNIIIISPNTLFEQYISQVLPELGESNVVSMVFEEILAKIIQSTHIQSRNQFLEHLITDSYHHKVIKSSIEFKTSQRFLEILHRFIDELPHKWIDFDDFYFDGQLIVSKERLKNKIVGRTDLPLGAKLRQLEDFIFELIEESKQGKFSNTAKSIAKNDIQKFIALDIISLYRKLLSDRAYFDSLAQDLKLDDNLDDILKFTLKNLNPHSLRYDDAIVLAYLNLKIYGTNDYRSIKQVVIDEAQDYYPLQYALFNLLFSKAKFTVLGDMNQTLEKQENISLYKQISQILQKEKSSLMTMDKSFRCTNEILTYSLKFIKQDPNIKSFNRKGDEPQVFIAADQISLNNMIMAEVKFCLEQGYQSVGLICKTERNALHLFNGLRDSIDLQLIKNESISDLHGVFIIPVYMSKGLEFDAVLICDADIKTYQSKNDRNFLYIACTRALHRLNVFCKGTASPLL